MTVTLRLFSVFFALLVPLTSAHATVPDGIFENAHSSAFGGVQAPAPATGLLAERQGDTVRVQWSEQPEDNIDYYRVYFSFESILDNDGIYDDTRETEGPVTEIVIPVASLPESDTVYFAVLGVNANGDDANSFVEEVSVSLASQASEAAEASKAEPEEGKTNMPDAIDNPVEEVMDEEKASEAFEAIEASEATTITLNNVTVNSPSEILLTFSDKLIVSPDKAPDAFLIIDSEGMPLPIIQMVIDANLITLTTKTQAKHEQYEIRVSEPAYNEDGLTLDPVKRRLLFEGHPNGTEPEPQPEPEPAPPPTANVTPPRTTVTPPRPPRSPLAQSGFGMGAAVAMAGGMLGFGHARRSGKKQNAKNIQEKPKTHIGDWEIL